MIKSSAKINVLITLLLLSGCASQINSVKMDEATAAKLRSEVTVYNSKQLSGLEYKTVKQIQATACGGRENAIDQLRYNAYSAGADGITKISCSSYLGPTFIQNCVTTTMCEAVAITVGTKTAETEKVEVPAEQQGQPGRKPSVPAPAAISEGEGFTLGKLPVVVTSYDAVGEAKDVEIIFSGNYMAKGKIVKRDRENNLAIITFEEFRRTPAGFRIFPSYKVKPGQNVYIIGGTQPGKNSNIAEGIISAEEGPGGDSRYFRLTAHSGLSNGGSPVLDARGRVIGIVSTAFNKASSAPANGHFPGGTYFALKSTLLLNLYPEIESLVNSDNGPTLPAQTISESYGSSIVTVTAK